MIQEYKYIIGMIISSLIFLILGLLELRRAKKIEHYAEKHGVKESAYITIFASFFPPVCLFAISAILVIWVIWVPIEIFTKITESLEKRNEKI